MLRASGQTTLSLPYALGNIANKSLLPRFENAETVWRKLATVRSLKDFKPATTVRFLLGAEGLKKVGKDGRLQHLALGDSSSTYSLGTRGGIIAITRTDYLNDDLGVFTEVPGLMGELFAVALEEEFFKIYLGRADWITSGTNQNSQTGASTALDIDAVTAAQLLFGNRVINNRHAGTLELVVTPYLNNTAIKDADGNAITGQSATIWFLQADPNVLPTEIVGFLNGRQAPYVEVDGIGTWNAEFDVLGCQMRVFGDFGVGAGETYGIMRSVGA